MKVITIGRSSECSVVINDVKVSRVHAQLVQDDEGRISVVDLGSTNGTKVNGKRIAGEMRLSPGDELRVGDTVLPWQNYMATIPSQGFQPVMANAQSSATVLGQDNISMFDAQPGKMNPKNNLLWIILAVVLGLFVAGGVVWLLLGRGSESTASPVTVYDTVDSSDSIVPNKSDVPSDSVGLSEYERYLLDIIQEKDKTIGALTQQKKKTPADTLNQKGQKLDPQTGEKTTSTTTTPPQPAVTDEDLIKQFEGLVNNANQTQTGKIYAEIVGDTQGSKLSLAGQKYEIKKKFKGYSLEQKKNMLAFVKSIIKK